MQCDAIKFVYIFTYVYRFAAAFTIAEQLTLLAGAASVTLLTAVLYTRKCHVLFQSPPGSIYLFSS